MPLHFYKSKQRDITNTKGLTVQMSMTKDTVGLEVSMDDLLRM